MDPHSIGTKLSSHGIKLGLNYAFEGQPNDVGVALDNGDGEDWEGFYAGIFAGYGMGELKAETTQGAAPSNTSVRGGLVGVTGGVNSQVDRFVVGVEGDVAWSSVTGSSACSPTQTCKNTLVWMSTVRGRVGISFDQVLLYGTAGAAIGGAVATTTPATVGSTGRDTQTFVGWAAGLGAEYAVSENVRLKAEYLYTDFGTRTSPAGTISANNAFNSSPNLHAIKLGLNYAF